MADSVLLIDKSEGPTSHDLVAGVRRQVGRGVKVGHAGTLDPFATGLLIVLTGRATRTQRLFMGLDKTYETSARFGAVSTTGDRDGVITETGLVPDGDLHLPTGEMMQRPPAYSAVKVGGRRAYDLARAGEQVELAERPIRVDSFAELWRSGDERGFRIRCSSGTYIRSLIADLGDAYCETLRRTAIGPFDVPDRSEPVAIPLVDALRRFMPEVELTEVDADHLAHGRIASAGESGSGAEPGSQAVATRAGRLVAVVEVDADRSLRSVIGFPSD